jgi:transposase InsO family protein
VVGARGFEPRTSCAQGRRATRLRYAPTVTALFILKHVPTPLLIHTIVLAPDCARTDYCTVTVHTGAAIRASAATGAISLADEYTRECLAIEVDQGIGGGQVAGVLGRITMERRTPKTIRVDNGPEFVSKALDQWAYRNGVKLDFSRPGKPTDNAFVESFNGTFRAECLNTHWFTSLTEAQQIVETWRQEYNESRPHRALGERTPNEFANEIAASRDFIGMQTAGNST